MSLSCGVLVCIEQFVVLTIDMYNQCVDKRL